MGRAQITTLLLIAGCATSSASTSGERWTLIVLPDTQVYAEKYPELFVAQTRWIREQAKARNIRFVAHVGDVVEHNRAEEWEVARRAFSELAGVVPYAIAPGNHDFGPGGSAETRDTLLHEYLPPAGELFEPRRLDNSAHLFEAGGRRWIVLALEWGPRDRAIAWANDMLARHRDRSAIIVTHAYLYPDGKRADHRDPKQRWNPHQYPTAALTGGVNDGEELWTKLVSRHANIVLVLSGHYGEDGGAARLTSAGAASNPVHQLLSDYQLFERGGEGYLRILEIDEAARAIRVKTYSPASKKYLTDPANQFELALPAKR